MFFLNTDLGLNLNLYIYSQQLLYSIWNMRKRGLALHSDNVDDYIKVLYIINLARIKDR